VGPWCDDLPAVLSTLAERWNVELGSILPRGSMSLVIASRTYEGRPAILKVSPDRARLANEASALDSWATMHTPSVLAVDHDAGAVLLEAIDPGVPLDESQRYPRLESVAELLTALGATGVPRHSYPRLADRVEYLFDSGTRPYERRPELTQVVPHELYARGRGLATRLAERAAPTGLLHGDLTPRNILEGGNERGLVAIDPAPCLGDDLAFDAVDLLVWQADDVGTIAARAAELAPAIDVEADRLVDWCTAFAAMTALELAETADAMTEPIQAAVTLAGQAPVA
jgi:streptomycin 6-kinase